MSDEAPKQRPQRKRSPFTASVDTILVRFTAKLLPHDSPEFRERAGRPRPDRTPPRPPDAPQADQTPPAE